jgi:EAL and modified HD-GYP domain-containing signal transduction protein
MAAIAPNVSLHMQRAKEFFLGRQPILNRDQSLAAYELLFRTAAAGPANVTDDLYATASVIAHASELGMENVIGASRGYVNVDAAVLMSDIIQFLPKERVVLEILETVKATDRVLERVAALAQAGYIFALDDVTSDSVDVKKLLPLVDIVKIDITDMKQSELFRLSSQFKAANKKLVAEKVENLAQFQNCLDLGFDYFQGYYFAKPDVLSGKKLSPSQMAIMQLLMQIVAEADTTEIERSIKQDASLSFTLLRLVNTPAAGVTQRIDSVGQALMVLGRRRLQHWLQILLYAQPGKANSATAPLLTLATTRGKLLELMVEKLEPGNRTMADIAFTVGIMSLMDTLFGLPMEKILEQIKVADDVSKALLFRKGIFGDMLKLVEYIENVEEAGPLVVPLLKKLRLSSDQFYALQLTAFEWSDKVSRTAA